jgi:hypothetical protein
MARVKKPKPVIAKEVIAMIDSGKESLCDVVHRAIKGNFLKKEELPVTSAAQSKIMQGFDDAVTGGTVAVVMAVIRTKAKAVLSSGAPSTPAGAK